jgi:hypothetical protein
MCYNVEEKVHYLIINPGAFGTYLGYSYPKLANRGDRISLY